MRLAFTCHGLLLAVLLVGFASTLGLATLEPMFALLGAGKPELLPLISEYMSVWYLAIPLLVIPMAGNSAIRASGDTKTPAKIMILAGLINGAFSTRCWSFGYGPFPGIRFKAPRLLADSVGLVRCVAHCVCVNHTRATWFAQTKNIIVDWKQILTIGTPAALSNALNPLAVPLLRGC